MRNDFFPGDIRTPEQSIPEQSDLEALEGQNWETCMTMNGTWGYRKSDNNWKSTETLITNLIDIASKGGNYLLNVGPKPDGTFPEESIELLAFPASVNKEKAMQMFNKVRKKRLLGIFGDEEAIENMQLRYMPIYRIEYNAFDTKKTFRNSRTKIRTRAKINTSRK